MIIREVTGHPDPEPYAPSDEEYVLAVRGPDRVGLLADVTQICKQHGLNILDLSTRSSDGQYVTLLHVDASRAQPLDRLRAALDEAGATRGFGVHAPAQRRLPRHQRDRGLTMVRSDQILSTVAMIQEEKLDVRAVTLGVSLLECRGATPRATADAVRARLEQVAGRLVAVCDRASERFGVPITNKRLAVTPVAHIAAGFSADDFVLLAHALDDAAGALGVDLLGGYSANLENGMSRAGDAWIDSLPEALSTTQRVCASAQVGTTRHGLNMDAVVRIAEAIVLTAARTADSGGFAAAKFVIFVNQPDDNPFMAGAIHGVGQPDASSTSASAARAWSRGRSSGGSPSRAPHRRCGTSPRRSRARRSASRASAS